MRKIGLIAAAVVSVAAMLASCASVSNLANEALGTGKPEFEGAFIDSAVTRVQAHYKPLVAPADGRPLRVSRSFSGEPSYLTEKSRRAIDESGGIVQSPAAQRYLQSILDRLSFEG